MSNPLNIAKGSVVKITLPNGYWAKGPVLSVDHDEWKMYNSKDRS